MKIRSDLYCVLGCLLLAILGSHARAGEDKVILSAMRDELTRNMTRLKLDNLEPPFFISYAVRAVDLTDAKASLGGLISSNQNAGRSLAVRVLVGDPKRTNEHFFDLDARFRITGLGRAALPLEDDYNGIRRAFWLATDQAYKKAAENLERKRAAIEQQNLSEEQAALADFSEATPVKLRQPWAPRPVDIRKVEQRVRAISAVLRDYPDIYDSHVHYQSIQGNVYQITSEGTETVQPMSLSMILVWVKTQADDGKELEDKLQFFALDPGELPDLKTMKARTVALAESLQALRAAPELDETYTGPVLFEEQAAGELLSQRFFSNNAGLVVRRKPIFGNPGMASRLNQFDKGSLENRMGRRVLSRDLSIVALSGLPEFENQKLIGNFTIDSEGVRPPGELTLVEGGILKSLLSNRSPTAGLPSSNGHARWLLSAGFFSPVLAPGVVRVTSSAGMTSEALKSEMLQLARDEGLPYAVLIKKMKPVFGGAPRQFNPMSFLSQRNRSQMMSEPVLVYRVFVEDGREELVRSVQVGEVSIGALRHIAGVSLETQVYNTVLPVTMAMTGNFQLGGLAGSRPMTGAGVPATFLMPRSFLFEELEIKKGEQDYTAKTPIVPSPLTRN